MCKEAVEVKGKPEAKKKKEPDHWAGLNVAGKAVLDPLADLGDKLFAFQKSQKLTQGKVDDKLEAVGYDRRLFTVARDASKNRKAAKLYAL